MDADAVGLSWAARLHDEGSEVLYYIHPKYARGIGEGIVPRTDSLHHMLAWAKAKPTIAVYTFTGMGKASPKIAVGAEDFQRAGIPVILGGTEMDRLENDREYGFKVAEHIGARIPPHFEFSTAKEAQTFCKVHGATEWYFKPNDMDDCDTTHGGTGSEIAEYLDYFIECHGNNRKNIVQMKVPGVAISTGAWFNGFTFLEPFEGTIEHKAFMNDDLGPSTGCSTNVVWFYDEYPKIAKDLGFDKLGLYLASKLCNPGLIDINAVVSEEAGKWGPKGVPYFLEFTPRCGWDSEAASMALLKGGLNMFLAQLARRQLERAPFQTGKLSYGLRLSLSPYPYMPKKHDEPMKPSPKGRTISGPKDMWNDFVGYSVAKGPKGFNVASDDGIIGVAVQTGTNLKSIAKKAEEFAASLQPKGLQYRTDGAKVLTNDAHRVSAAGYPIPMI